MQGEKMYNNNNKKPNYLIHFSANYLFENYFY